MNKWQNAARIISEQFPEYGELIVAMEGKPLRDETLVLFRKYIPDEQKFNAVVKALFERGVRMFPDTGRRSVRRDVGAPYVYSDGTRPPPKK